MNQQGPDPQKHEEDDVSRSVRNAFSADVSPELEERLRSSLRGFREDLQAHPYVRKLGGGKNTERRSLAMKKPINLAVAAVAILVIAIVMFFPSTPTTDDTVSSDKLDGGADKTSLPPAANVETDTTVGGSVDIAREPLPKGTATVRGKVVLRGAPPKMPVLSMTVAECIASHPNGLPVAEDVITGPGGSLANCFVYISKGLEGRRFPRPTEPVKFDQSGCIYTPHVFGVRSRQDVVVTNSDPTLHNVHTLPKLQAETNRPQPKGAPPIVLNFRKPEAMVTIKCDVHPWMNAYAGVVDHPYFAVTGVDGTFRFPDKIAPGTYTVTVWHEFYKTQSKEITVGDDQVAEIDFTFDAS